MVPFPCDCAKHKEYAEHMEQQRLDESQRIQSNMISQLTPTVQQTNLNDLTALAATQNNRFKKNNGHYCDYCNMKEHRRENCYKLVGDPSNHKFNKSRTYDRSQSSRDNKGHSTNSVSHGHSANSVSHVEEPEASGSSGISNMPLFTSEQYNQLLKLNNHEPAVAQAKDLCTGKVRGIDKEKDGLYILQPAKKPSPVKAPEQSPAIAFNTTISTTNFCPVASPISVPAASPVSVPAPTPVSACSPSKHSDQCSIWHQRPGHAPLAVLQKIQLLKDHDLNIEQLSCTICPFSKTIRSDNGLKFFNAQCATLFTSLGIVHQSSCVHTPQQNGVAERKHRHLLEMARALRFQAYVPLKFWGECVLTAAFIVNRLPSSVLSGKSPYEPFHGQPPSLTHLKVFGCLCYETKPCFTDKFSSKAIPAIFMGYSKTQKGYKLYNISSGTFLVSRDVCFRETTFPFRPPKSAFLQSHFPNSTLTFPSPASIPSYDDTFLARDDVPSYSPPTSVLTPEPLTAQPEPSSPQPPSSLIMQPNITTSPPSPIEPQPTHIFDTTLRKSARTSNPPLWLTDYVHQVKSTSTPYPISSSLKYYSSLPSYQACLTSYSSIVEPTTFEKVAKDSNWVQAMELEVQALTDNNTWELVDLPAGRTLIGCKWVYKMVTVRSVVALAAQYGWPLLQMDVYNAFLQGDHSEEVYMSLPQGFGNDKFLIQEAKDILNHNFKMKDLGELKFFLGRAKPSISPLDQNMKLTSAEYEKLFGMRGHDTELEDIRVYQRLIGRLLYLAITRPDISYAVQVLSQFMNALKQSHYDAALRVVKYIKNCPGQGLLMSSKQSRKVFALCDADWASCSVTRKHITGFCIKPGDSMISWKSKKSSTVSRSSAEVEYRSMASIMVELTWIHGLPEELGMQVYLPKELYCDNKVAIQIASNPMYHEGTKDIEIDCHFIREKLQQGMIKAPYVPSKDQIADILTKALGKQLYSEMVCKLGMINIFSSPNLRGSVEKSSSSNTCT
ncbi:PREDICTED: uncharacterized protein LOC109224480 [Nicotiana attenuata]|uniref:uncharacterized protein LOC109224480 n=1 Tax=Nicotiana attenuata TaxID=49451 RepID=UPI0009058896|nr:PREDICTED: uncharacterized protein LOC109224480 [Nicotiana attenuata]